MTAAAGAWLRFVTGARSASVSFPAPCSESTILVGSDWVRFDDDDDDDDGLSAPSPSRRPQAPAPGRAVSTAEVVTTFDAASTPDPPLAFAPRGPALALWTAVGKGCPADAPAALGAGLSTRAPACARAASSSASSRALRARFAAYRSSSSRRCCSYFARRLVATMLLVIPMMPKGADDRPYRFLAVLPPALICAGVVWWFGGYELREK